MGAKSGNGAIPGGWTPISAAVFTFVVISILWGVLLAIVVADRELKKVTQLKQFQVEIDALSKQLDNYEKLLREKKITVVPAIMKLRPQLDKRVAQQISDSIIKYSRKYQIPPEFIVWLIKRESRFNVLAVSKMGAIGLMQVMPKAHRDKMEQLKIGKAELYHIDNNVHLGSRILREYYDKTGSIDKALKKYVGGSHPSYTNDILVGYANETIPLKPELTESKLPVAFVN